MLRAIPMSEDLRQDLFWGLLIGAVLAASPLTGAARPLASIVLGGAAGVAIVIGRMAIRRSRPGTFASAPAANRGVEVRPVHWTLFGCLALLFTPTLHWLYEQYTFSIWRNAHGLFLPIIIATMIRARLRALPPDTAGGQPLGVLIVLTGAALAVVDAGMRTGYLGTLGLIVCLPGLALWLLGRERTRAIAFPLALVVFVMPVPLRWPDPLWLTTGTSLVMEQIFTLVGIPTMRHQTFFVMSSGMFNVSTNCGGHAFFYASLLLALLLASQTDSIPRRIVILLATWPVTVFVNGIRGAVLVGATNRYGAQVTDSFLHGLSGILTFWGVVTLMMLLADWPRLLRRAHA